MKYIYIIVLSGIFFSSCEKVFLEPTTNSNTYQTSNLNSSSSEPCTLNCSEWEKCTKSGSGDPFDFGGPRIWKCENVFNKYRFSGRGYCYRGVQTIDDNQNTITNDIFVKVGFPTANQIILTLSNKNPCIYALGEEEAFDIQIIFTDSESGFFNVNNYSVYNPLIDANVLYNGSGSFVKNGSSASYTLELNLTYNHNGSNHDLYLIVSNQV